MADKGSGDGLLGWLVGGLLLGGVVLGLVVAAYAVGYDRGKDEGASAAAPAAPATTATTATTTTAEPATGAADLSAQGAEVFAAAGCGGCHTFAAAGATGTVGPNLDDAKPSPQLVTELVTNGQGVMPSFEGQLSDAEIQAVAAYVSERAGG